MPELQRLRPDHVAALLAFERANRAYFAASVPDRGDDYFAHFAERLQALLAEQEAGICHFHVLVDPDGAVLGRFNLVDVADGTAELGFRVAERVAGRGVATGGVARVCELAAGEYGLTSVQARAALANAGSRAVLARSGFEVIGETVLSGQPALRFERKLV